MILILLKSMSAWPFKKMAIFWPKNRQNRRKIGKIDEKSARSPKNSDHNIDPMP
jgi:hypothetical protein